MTTDFRAELQDLHTSIQLYTGQNPAAADVHPAELTRRLMDAMAASAAALAQPEPVVDDNFVSTVNDLAERTHKSKAEVLRDAINLYYKAVNEWEKNGRGIVFQNTTQSEPPDLTDDELLEIRDGAYCPSVNDVNDEEDSMWQYTSDYISWLHGQGTIEEQQEYEAKGLRAVFNAGRRARRHG
jgi:hypothetical protein